MTLPKNVEEAIVSDEKCPSCAKAGRNVKKLKLEFPAEVVTEEMGKVLQNDDGTSGTFCVWPDCDDDYQLLLEQTKYLPNKRTYNEAFNNDKKNGVPNYYY
mmetsp:Transcript_39949/g.38508  ORF Transcript_39949/g.38508 Transcript_39949/m.38508 type:complete len:101 (+) Transcript_39949:712-1014(+)